MANLVPCKNPAKCGVQNHMEGTLSARQCEPAVQSKHGGSGSWAGTPKLSVSQSSIDEVRRVAAEDALEDFRYTELGEQFTDLELGERPDTYEGTVAEPFLQGHRKFNEGDLVYITVEDKIVRHRDSSVAAERNIKIKTADAPTGVDLETLSQSDHCYKRWDDMDPDVIEQAQALADNPNQTATEATTSAFIFLAQHKMRGLPRDSAVLQLVGDRYYEQRATIAHRPFSSENQHLLKESIRLLEE